MVVGDEQVNKQLNNKLKLKIESRYGKGYLDKYRKMFLDQLNYIESLGVPDKMTEQELKELREFLESE